jgi:hypothetical protein
MVRPFSILLLAIPAFAGAPTTGEVNCDKGVDIAKVQALVKRTASALKKDRDKVVQEINQGDPQWKDGDYYVVVFQGTRAVAHGLLPSTVNREVGTIPWVRELQRVAMEKGEGCVQHHLINPSKEGQAENKVSYAVKVNDMMWAVSGTFLVQK